MKRSKLKASSGFVMAASMAAAFLCGPLLAAGTSQPSVTNSGTANYAQPQRPSPGQPSLGQSGATSNAEPPGPGTINYLEGQASLGTRPLAPYAIGGARLGAGDTLTTQAGRAEVLLTPGIFFRVANNSAVQMISPGLENTVVMLERGRALVEVDNILPENNVMVNANGVSTRLLKAGLYEFDADHGAVRVFDGKATVQANGRTVEVKGDHQVITNGAQQIKARKFDKRDYEDDFYRWASLRSSYLTEANVDAARRYAGGSGWAPGLWNGADWYWDPWFDAYTFIPGDGIFYSPFGFGFYSPWYAYGAPFGYGFFGGYHHFGPGYRAPFGGGAFAGSYPGHAHSFNGGAGFRGGGFGAAGGMRGGFDGGGFRSGGGFHGGGGGFHGGGGGGHR